jgi:hypothetical protein
MKPFIAASRLTLMYEVSQGSWDVIETEVYDTLELQKTLETFCLY